MNNPKVLFIYNANSGIHNKVIDSIHKNISPDSYKCKLCFVSYDNLGKKKEWKKYLDTLSFEYEFLYKNQVKEKYPDLKYLKLPAIYVNLEKKYEVLINSEELEKVNNINELINLMKKKLN